jgi:hypothetical protein
MDIKEGRKGWVVGFKGLCCGVVKNKVRAMIDKTWAVVTCRFFLCQQQRKAKEHAIGRTLRARTIRTI